MSKAHGKGQLQHHFWGSYVATICIIFGDAEVVKEVLPHLPGFEVHPTDPGAAVFRGGGDAFETAKAAITRWRVPMDFPANYWGNDESIDSVAKSVDFGPLFCVEVEFVPNVQMALPFG